MKTKKTFATFATMLAIFFFIPKFSFAQSDEGIVIAVPLPQMKSAQKTDEWIPQFMQDSLTTNLARYSKMTVIDRANESLSLAEQKISASASHDESTAIEIGKMTNAQYVLAGSVQALSKNYSANFRVNNIETNEIKTSFQKNYTLEQIENGEAVQEISKEIMLGLGIELDNAALAALDKTSDKTITVNQNLAKGAAAEKNEDFFTALQYFSKVREEESANAEANKSIQNIFGGNISTQGLKAQIEYGQNMIKRWNKIFADLKNYAYSEDIDIVIYDFSNVETSIRYSSNKTYVDFTISPGIKLIPNRSTLILYKTIIDDWKKTSSKPENKEWAKAVKTTDCYYYIENAARCIDMDLLDEYGDKIGEKRIYLAWRHNNYEDVLAQQKYFAKKGFEKIIFSDIDAEKVTDTVTPKLRTILGKFPKRYFSVQEYEEWLAAGCP